MRTKKQIPTVHDELFTNLINIGTKPIKLTYDLGFPYFYREIVDKKYKIQLRAGIPKGKIDRYTNISSIEDLEEQDKQKIEKKLSFTALETFTLYILLVPIAENEELEISLSQIHKCYRGKKIENEILDSKAKDMYMNTIEDLTEKQISIVTNADYKRKSGLSNIVSVLPLVFIRNIENRNNDIIYYYSLGELERIIKLSRRFSSEILPADFFHLPIKKIVIFKIGVYLSNLIFINRRKNQNYFLLKLKSFMKAIPYFNNEGKTQDVTYLDKMEENISNKTTILRRFFKSIIRVLEIYKKNNKISHYEIFINFDSKSIDLKNKNIEKQINVKNFETIKFKIYFK